MPKVVNAVTADDLGKNNIQRLDEVATLVAGLNLQNAGNGEVQNATIRGAAYNVDSGLKPTVQFYLNDANIVPNFVFQSMSGWSAGLQLDFDWRNCAQGQWRASADPCFSRRRASV